jgi:hypothetical protein
MYKKNKQNPISTEIKKRKWMGHTLRKPPSAVTRAALE